MRINKATTTEASLVILTVLTAAILGKELADQHVSIAAITTAVTFVLTGGLGIVSEIAKGMRTTTYACPADGCTVTITARNTSDLELQTLQALATDHTKHGGTR